MTLLIQIVSKQVSDASEPPSYQEATAGKS